MKDIFNAHQRFSIRKYSFGAASVLLGTVFLAQGQVAQAETENSSEPSSAVTATGDSNSDPSSTTETVASTETSAPSYSAPAVESANSTTSSSEEASASTAATSNVATTVEVKETVNKSVLKDRIAALQAAISSAHKGTDAAALNFANTALSTANTLLANEDATQAEVDTQANALAELVTTVNEASNQAKAAQADEKAANEAASQPAEKTELEKTVSEAVVTNRLANNFVEKEAKEKEVAVDLTDAVKAAVANNEANITASNQVLADKGATTDALKTATQQLQSSIEAVYVSLRKAGKEEFEVVLPTTAAASNGDYEVGNPSVTDVSGRMTNSGTVTDSSHAMANNTLIIDGV